MWHRQHIRRSPIGNAGSVAESNCGSPSGGIGFTLENYALPFQDKDIFNALRISVFTTGMCLITGLFFTSLVAYAMSVRTLPGRQFFNFFWYFNTIFGGGMIPYFLVLRTLG
ncbi:MAG: hypothetical protein J5602_03385 [Clostridia bacterium]|nr:hypothetical protein [Clostridia bacterium]